MKTKNLILASAAALALLAAPVIVWATVPGAATCKMQSSGVEKPTILQWAVIQQVTYDADDDDTCYVAHTTVTYGPYISDETGGPGTFRLYADGAPTKAVGDYIQIYIGLP